MSANATPHAEYVRTRGGRMVHRRGCVTLKHATRAVPWTWAEGRDLMWVEACLEWNGVGGVAFCRTCCSEVQYDSEELDLCADWPNHCDLHDGLGWVASQLEGCR